MCIRYIDIYECGEDHKEVDEIPCAFSRIFDDDCPRKGADDINIYKTIKCHKCLDRDNQTAPNAPPYDPVLYFKQKTLWSKCSHHDSPVYTFVKRKGDPNEWLIVKKKGLCLGCKRTHPNHRALMKLEGRFDGDPYGAMQREPAVACPTPSGYRASFIAHVRDEAHPPGSRLPDWMNDPTDDDYLDEPHAGNPNILPGCANNEDFAAWFKGNTLVKENAPADVDSTHMTSGRLVSPERSQNLPSKDPDAASVPKLSTIKEDNLKFYNQGNYGASLCTQDKTRGKEKPGKGKDGKSKDRKQKDGEGKSGKGKEGQEGQPQRPFRRYSPNHPWEV